MSSAVAFANAPIYANALSCQRTVTSAAGVLAQLEGNNGDPLLKAEAIIHLESCADIFWSELANYTELLVSLQEDSSFPEAKRTALLLSKVYYHLMDYDKSMEFALKAEEKFDLSERSEYVEKLVTICIDRYIQSQVSKDVSGDFNLSGKADTLLGGSYSASNVVDPRLTSIVERMFAKCKQDKEYLYGLGIAIECKRLDKVQDFVISSPNMFNLIDYCQSNLRNPGIGSKFFRRKLVDLLIEIYKKHGLSTSSNSTISTGQRIKFVTKLLQCYVFANDVESTKDLLVSLLLEKDEVKLGNGVEKLMVFQLAFDVDANENQEFNRKLVAALKTEQESIVGKSPEEGSNEMSTYDAEKDEHFQLLLLILTGHKKLDLNLEFLFKSNRTDLLLVDKCRKSFDSAKNSVLHTGHILMHAICQAGTTSDVYLRKNLDWMGKSVMWAKFSTTASLGVVHRGHIRDSRNILSTYLPRDDGGGNTQFYSEGGALYAMGLIHANHYDEQTESYLLEKLKQAPSDILKHGACLGLGLSSMGTWHRPLTDEMKVALYTDNAISSEAAAYGIGLVLCGAGKGSEYIKELLSYAHDTAHEKIIRGCAVGLALIMYSQEEAADETIGVMCADKDPILRYGGMFCIGMAYCGTSSAVAINKLLHFAVSDVSDDVRRAAVISLGFVMCNAPSRVPQMVKLLSTSYNPHVRYAAALALGISNAGTESKECEGILRPLLTDNADFVRQGAYIAMGLLYQQSVSEAAEKFRTDITRAIGDKHEDQITRFGALLAQGLIDAGGRNVHSSFFSKSGAVRQGAAVGFLMFTQMWYWFPLIHFVCLTLNPTAIIGLNKNLKMPKSFCFTSDVSKSQGTGSKKFVKQEAFSYPEPTFAKTEEVVATTTKAVLSGAKKKFKDVLTQGAGAAASSTSESKTAEGSKGSKEKGTADKEKVEKKAELPAVLTLYNPSRVVPAQERFIVFPDKVPKKNLDNLDAMEVDGEEKKDKEEKKVEEELEPARYVPLLGRERQSGFLLLTDLRPTEEEELIETLKEVQEKEPDPPAEFVYNIDEDEKV